MCPGLKGEIVLKYNCPMRLTMYSIPGKVETGLGTEK